MGDINNSVPTDVVNNISNALREQGILTPRVLAYALATIKGETGDFTPKREIAGPQQAQRLGYSGGTNYYGRGYIQLTHDYNYADIGRKIGVDLLNNPDLALDPEISAKILAVFFKERGIAQKAEAGDFVGARRGINPDARGNEIASYAQNYLSDPSVIKATTQPTSTLAQARPQTTPENKNIFDRIQEYFTPKQAYGQEYSTPIQNRLQNASYGNSTPMASYMPAYSENSAYSVQPGDTLWDIAARYLGSGSRYKELGYSGDPRMLQIGTQLNIPRQSSAPRPNTSTNAGPVYSPPPSAPAPSRPVASGPQQNYTPARANYSSSSGYASYAPPPQTTTRPTSNLGALYDFTPAKTGGSSATLRF